MHPVTGEQLGRKAANSGQAGAERREAYLERLLAAEPHAAAERRRYLAWQATVATRPTAPYTDVTASWSKSISVLHRPIVREGITGLADASAAGRSIWPAGFGERTFKVDQVEVGREAPPDHIRLLLDLPDEEAVVVVRKRRYVLDGKPVLVSVSYLPSDVTSGTRIEQEDTGPGGTYARLAETGHAPVRFREDLRSRMPEPRRVGTARHPGRDTSRRHRQNRLHRIRANSRGQRDDRRLISIHIPVRLQWPGGMAIRERRRWV